MSASGQSDLTSVHRQSANFILSLWLTRHDDREACSLACCGTMTSYQIKVTLTITLLHLVWQFERLNSGIPGKHKTPISRGVSLQRCQRWGRLPKSRNGVAFFGSRGGAGRQKWPFLGTAPPFFAYFGVPSLFSPAFGSPFMSKCLWGANIHWSDVMWTVWDEYDKNIDSPSMSKENMSDYKSVSLEAINSSSSHKQT